MGYKHMCRFNALQIWSFVSKYDYVMRLDDDSFIESDINYDIFEFMRDRNLDYGYIHTEHDYHEQTIATLPQFTRSYIQTYNVDVNCSLEEIDALYFYTNFFITRVSFWHQLEVKNFLRFIDESLGIYQYRWGDHVIQAHALKMFSTPQKLYQFQDFRYSHASHSWSNYKPNGLDLFLTRLDKKLRRRFEPHYLNYLLKRSQAS
jgi:alpha 1,2-mannosyltransferase